MSRRIILYNRVILYQNQLAIQFGLKNNADMAKFELAFFQNYIVSGCP